MNILYCTSEAYPLIKTGGLADVAGSLPTALNHLGNEVRIALPAYPQALERAINVKHLTSLHLDHTAQPVQVLEGRLPDSDVSLYLIDSPAHFARDGNPYLQPDGREWPDNAERFATFGRAVVALANGASEDGWRPDLVHCNDWQTGLVPALLAQQAQRPATLFTIHNLSYQGLFPADTFSRLGLPPSLWSIDGVEFYNQLSFLKGGIACADHVSTVSPTYAREICTPRFGYGLEGLLQHRADRLSGILNGMDCSAWNPRTDPHLEQNYDVHRLQRKAFNKAALQRELGLPVDAQTLLIGYVGRLVDQKGIDLIIDVLERLFHHPVQLAILGSGDAALERRIAQASDRFPKQLGARIGYDEGLAHRIEAGIDCFLMPSRFEPCGLNQLYSLRYGSVPIVNRTGGLADSVIDLDDASAQDYTATGLTFDAETPDDVLEVCLRALRLYRGAKVDWWKLVITGMKQDFCWLNSATQYMELYRQLRSAEPAGTATTPPQKAALP